MTSAAWRSQAAAPQRAVPTVYPSASQPHATASSPASTPTNLVERPRAAVTMDAWAVDALFDMFRRYPGNVLKGMGARYIDGVFFNVFGVFSIAYLTSTLKISRTDALLGVMAAALVMIVTIPLFGRLSDRVGRQILSTNPFLASAPAFGFVGTKEPELYHQNAEAIFCSVVEFGSKSPASCQVMNSSNG